MLARIERVPDIFIAADRGPWTDVAAIRRRWLIREPGRVLREQVLPGPGIEPFADVWARSRISLLDSHVQISGKGDRIQKIRSRPRSIR